MGWVILKSIVWTFVDLHAFEQMQLRGHRHVDAAGPAVDGGGRIYATTRRGVAVLAPDGILLGATTRRRASRSRPWAEVVV